MKDNAEKATILKLREFEVEIIDLINNSGIPSFILRPSFEKICKQLEFLESQEYLKAKELYESKMKDGDKNA